MLDTEPTTFNTNTGLPQGEGLSSSVPILRTP